MQTTGSGLASPWTANTVRSPGPHFSTIQNRESNHDEHPPSHYPDTSADGTYVHFGAYEESR